MAAKSSGGSARSSPWSRCRDLFQSDFLAHVQQAAETYARLLQGQPVSFAVFKQSPWNHYGILALEQTQLSLRTPFLDNDLIRPYFERPSLPLPATRILCG